MAEVKKMLKMESKVTLCAVQMEPQIGYKEKNIARSLELIEEAADHGANIIILPELCTTGYMFHNRQEAYEAAELVPEGSACVKWAEIAKRKNVYIAAGITELEKGGLRCYNSAVLIGPTGHMGTYRKLHLWGDEKLFFEPGDLGLPVFETPYGRIGMLICYDMWFFEAFRLLALKGADVVCCPSNWIDGPPAELRTMGPHMAMANATANHIFVVGADRIGTERGCTYPGRSLIVGPSGWYKAGPASDDKEEIIYAEVNLMEARRLNRSSMNVIFRDRRIDLYDEMLGSGETPVPR